MTKYTSLLVAAAFAITAAATAADTKTVLCDFESTVDYSGNAATWASPAIQDTVVLAKQAGISGNGIKVDYTYQGDSACTYAGFHSWDYPVATFATSVDMAEADGFSVWIKNETVSPFSVMFYVKDAAGEVMRIMYSGLLPTAHTDWTEVMIPLAQSPTDATGDFGHGLQTSIWKNSGRAIDLSKIAEFGITVYDREGVQTDGSFSFELDDFSFFVGTDNEQVIKKFDFATDSATDWSSFDGGVVSQGTGTMNLTTTLATWVPKGAEIELPETIDCSNLAYAKFDVEGDAIMAAVNPTLDLHLIDVNDKVMASLAYNVLKAADGGVSFAPTHTAGCQDLTYYGLSCWRFGTYSGDYNANKDFDATQVKKIRIGYEPQQVADPDVVGQEATIKIKSMTLAATAKIPVGPQPEGAKTIDCVWTDQPIAMDGTGSDAAWNKAAWSTAAFTQRGSTTEVPADFQGKFKTMWDETSMYFLLEFVTGATDGKHYGINNNANQLVSAYYDGTNFMNEFDIFVSPAGNTQGSSHYYQIMPYFETDATGHQPTASNNGFFFGAIDAAGSWANVTSANIEVKAKEDLGAQKVTFEVKVPYAGLNDATANGGVAQMSKPAVGDTWYGNVCHWANQFSGDTPNTVLAVWGQDPADLQAWGKAYPMGSFNFVYAAEVADWELF
ncbi:hypothetical protein GX645_00870 [Candidatus Sumerlaeota bacterium]|nr:hypothetical protein [Candidatus Sumerlaeota bacterium]